MLFVKMADCYYFVVATLIRFWRLVKEITLRDRAEFGCHSTAFCSARLFVTKQPGGGLV